MTKHKTVSYSFPQSTIDRLSAYLDKQPVKLSASAVVNAAVARFLDDHNEKP